MQVNQSTGAITNKAQLHALGLGASEAEAELVARWMLGDPALKNPAVLGAFVNSTPIDVGPPGAVTSPGGKAFADRHKSRPNLLHVGSSDGMLHAFFTRETAVGTARFRAGEEAFAHVPPDMLKVITRLYAQNGQKPNPGDHIFGLASSPKVKNLCTSGCALETSATSPDTSATPGATSGATCRARPRRAAGLGAAAPAAATLPAAARLAPAPSASSRRSAARARFTSRPPSSSSTVTIRRTTRARSTSRR